MSNMKRLMFYGGALAGKVLEIARGVDKYIYSPDIDEQARRSVRNSVVQSAPNKLSITVQSPMAFAESTLPAPLAQHPQEYHRRTVVAQSPSHMVSEECFVHYSWNADKVLEFWNEKARIQHTQFPITHRLPVDSSTICWVGYDDLYQTLDVCLGSPEGQTSPTASGPGKMHPESVRRYFGVPTKEVFKFLSAESKGRYFNDRIKQTYGPSIQMPYTPWQLKG